MPISDVTKAFDGAGESVATLHSGIDGLNKAVLEGGNAMTALASSIGSLGTSGQQLTGSLASLTDVIPGLKLVGGAFNIIGSSILAVSSIAKNFIKVIDEAAGVMDGLTGISRGLSLQLFEVAAGFGGGYDAAYEYKNMLLGMATDLADYEFGFINLSESKQMFESARQAKLSLEDLTTTIITSDTTMVGYAAGILQASSMGLKLAEYSNLLGDAIYGQGLNTKEAMIQLSTFRNVAGDTGVSLDDVTSTLQGLSRSFRTMGVEADFGEPILRGFAASLDDIGLGAENAKALTENLSKSIANIAFNPALAYVTSQFGNLGYGKGGSALSASYEIQAKLIEAEKTGDQAAVGAELAGAMRDVLTKLGGGSIVTVQQAAADASLAPTAYKQQQILEGMYGLDSQSSARTLEMLANLENATKSGDKDLEAQLAKDFADGKNVRNSTRGFQEAISSKVSALGAQAILQTSALQQIGIHLGLRGIDKEFKEKSEDIAGLNIFEEMVGKIQSSEGKAAPTAEALAGGANMSYKDLASMAGKVVAEGGDPAKMQAQLYTAITGKEPPATEDKGGVGENSMIILSNTLSVLNNTLNSFGTNISVKLDSLTQMLKAQNPF